MTVGEWVMDGGWLAILCLCIILAILMALAGRSFYKNL